jgi:hypothetical protein
MDIVRLGSHTHHVKISVEGGVRAKSNASWMEPYMRPTLDFTGASPKRILSVLLRVAAVMALVGFGVAPARAQQTGAEPGWQILVTPYLWIPGVSAKVQTPLPQRSTISSNRSFSDLIPNLDGVPFEGAAELRYGPFGLSADFLHLPVATNIPTRDVFFQGGKAALTSSTGTAVLFYRGLSSSSMWAWGCAPGGFQRI